MKRFHMICNLLKGYIILFQVMWILAILSEAKNPPFLAAVVTALAALNVWFYRLAVRKGWYPEW